MSWLLWLGCDGAPYASGAGEPIWVREGTFHPGPLPSSPSASSPLVRNAGGVGSIVSQGQANLSYSGLATDDASAVAIAFPGVGTGFWVVPTGGPDVTQNGDLVFEFTVDYGPEVPYGLQTLTLVAVDADGRAGPPYRTTVCVLPESANGSLAACDPELPSPSSVVSLGWDTPVDLDLIVISPNGKVVAAKSPTTALVPAGEPVPAEVLADPSTGRLSRDSNAGCDIDGTQLESLVFPGAPPPGEYLVYANLSAACGQPYVHFELTRFDRIDAGDGTFPVLREDLLVGELLAVSAGDGFGTYLATLTLPRSDP